MELKTNIGTIIGVTLITLLIWFWAEGETREERNVYTQIQFLPGDPERFEVSPTRSFPLAVDLSGSKRALDRATEMLRVATVELTTGIGGVPAQAGDHTLNMADILNNLRMITDTGVTVTRTDPATQPLQVNQLTSLQVDVVASLPGAETVGKTVIEPAKATVRIPSRMAESIKDALRVEAIVDSRLQEHLEPGSRHSLEVPLQLPDTLRSLASSITIQPKDATVTFTLSSRTRTLTMNLVPVQVSGPPEEFNEYEVQLDPGDQFLKEVQLRGPNATIEQIEAGKIPIFAFVHLSGDDIALKIEEKPVSMWMLPEGVTVEKIAGQAEQNPMIRLSINPRSKQVAP
ncbi:MAG: hypothetical protein CMJ32_11700 [Phycisphaerae bacterium]|nr:hypothetical protein [Phycisphaerae bacterium]